MNDNHYNSHPKMGAHGIDKVFSNLPLAADVMENLQFSKQRSLIHLLLLESNIIALGEVKVFYVSIGITSASKRVIHVKGQLMKHNEYCIKGNCSMQECFTTGAKCFSNQSRTGTDIWRPTIPPLPGLPLWMGHLFPLV
jgi:hypothetical protein